MVDVLYVGLQDEDRIAVCTIDGDSGRLNKQDHVASPGGPSVMAISADRQTLYVGHRTQPSIASLQAATSDSLRLGIVPVLRANSRLTGVMSSSSRCAGVSALSSTVGRMRSCGFSAATSARCSSGPMNEPSVIARSTKQSPPGYVAEIASLRSQ